MMIPCPQCAAPSTLAPTNEFRPFCSERCKLIDLGAWLEGDYAIAGDSADAAGTQDGDPVVRSEPEER